MVTAQAPAPSRATQTITFQLGATLVLPLSVHTGVEETRVSRKEFFQADPNVPVGRSPVRKDTGDVIDNADVVRMAQAESGEWVILTDDEIAGCTTDRGMATVECFVPVTKLGQYLVQDVKQVRPKREKGKPNPAYEKVFSLFLAGLKASKVNALVKVAMRGPARYALLDCEGNLFLIASADQVRQAMPVTEFKHTAGEVSMIRSLIDAVGIDTPVLTDDTAPVVQAFVNSKATGKVTEITPAAPAIPCDIMSQLSASIDAAKTSKKSKAA